MNCIKCQQRYHTQRIPRVLIQCGHTICQICLTQNHKNGFIICIQCDKINFGAIQNFPKNLTLLTLNQSKITQNKINQNQLCKVHKKKYQGYCERDKQLLCVSCILDQKHRNHQISSISNTVEKDKQILQNSSLKIESQKEGIQKITKTIGEFQQKLKNNYQICVNQINSFYETLKQSINYRQQQTKLKAHEIFIKQLSKFDQLKRSLQQKYEFLNDLIKMYDSLIKLKDFQYLNQSNKRIFIVQNSHQKIPKLDIDIPSINFYKNDQIHKIQTYLQQLLQTQKDKRQKTSKNFKKKSNKQQKKQSVLVLALNLNQKYKKHMQTKQKQKDQKKSEKFQQQKFNLSEIRYKSSDSSYYQNSMQDIFKSSRDCSISIRDKQYQIQQFQTKIYHFGGFGFNYVEYYNIEKGISKCINNCVQRVKFQTVYLKNSNKILIIGGKQRQSGQKLQSILSFDINNQVISESPLKLTSPRSGFGAVAKQDKLYIVGGADSKTILNTLEQYNLKTGKVKKLSNMSTTRDQLSAVIGYDGYLYVIGGVNSRGISLNCCQRYDFSKNKWQILQNMNNCRRSFSLVNAPDGIYAIGGYDGKNHLSSVQKLDFIQNSWIIIKNMNEGRSTHSGVCTFDYQKILVFGGYGNNKNSLKSIQMYNINENRWQVAGMMNSERYMHSSIIIRNNI